MKLRNYLLFLGIGLAVLIGLSSTVARGILGMYLDPASILFVLVFLVILHLVPGRFTAIRSYYRAVFSEEPVQEIIKKGSRFFGSLILYTLCIGIMGFVIGIIGAMIVLEDTASLGPALAVALLTLFYSVLINLLVLIPFKIVLDQKRD